MSLVLLKKILQTCVSAKRKETNERFFKMGKGEYGYGDQFIGVSGSDIKKVAKQFIGLSFVDIKKLLQSKIHEERTVAITILVLNFEKGDKKIKKKIYDFYLKNFKYVNNWDLVDLSAYKIVGEYILENPKEGNVLEKHAKSKNLWERRLSIVATWAFIRKSDFRWTMKNAKVLLPDSHDLTHKAVGWMLREVWKRDSKIVESFLIKNYKQIPRTTLRYAIERMEEKRRRSFLKGF